MRSNDRSTCAPLATLLEPRFTVITYDRRGRGESGDTAPYAVEREVEDLDALIAVAGGSAAVFGYSSGAILALKAAIRGSAQESDIASLADDPALLGRSGWADEMMRRGVFVLGEGLRPVAEATTVRVRGDEVLLPDGPFAETKDQIGGFNVVDCADLDEAIEVAAKHPAARSG